MSEEVPPDQKMSILIRQSMEDRKFWFNELIRESFNFDEEVLWPNIELLLKKRRLAEVGIPNETEVEAFVRMKMEDLNHSQHMVKFYVVVRRVLPARSHPRTRQTPFLDRGSILAGSPCPPLLQYLCRHLLD